MNYWKVSVILTLFLLLGLTGAVSAADLSVSGSILAKPTIDFSGTPTSGCRPLTVAFTATNSGGAVDTWAWNFGDGGTSAVQNPSHQYTTAGTYTVTLTATNAGGSDVKTKTGYITVYPNVDLSITGVVNTMPAYVFANEANTLYANGIKNSGTDTATNVVVKFYASDVDSGNTAIAQYTIPSIATGVSVNIPASAGLTDPTIRTTAGGSVRYTAKADPDNLIPETNEANNAKQSTIKTVLYNGYKGVQYWTGKTAPHTYLTYDLHGNIIHSFGDSQYMSGKGSNWQTLTWHYHPSDLQIPAGATIKAVRLYIPYCWDAENEVDNGLTTTTFNGATVTPAHYEWDQSNFGAYDIYRYGLLTYDVTPQFVKNGENVVTFTRTYWNYNSPLNPGQPSSISPAGFTVAVVYEDQSATRKQIFINEGWDILGAAVSSYGTTEAEATSYQDFTGMTIDMAHATKANLITFVPWGSYQNVGESGEGNLFVNGVQIGHNVWNYGEPVVGQSDSPQVAVDTRDVLGNLNAGGTGNGIAIQSTAGGSPLMVAERAFLVVEFPAEAPVADFTATPVSGNKPLTVAFTDTSTGTGPFTYAWDFNNDGTTDSTDKNPSWTYTTIGTYTVKLTVTGPGGSDDETKINYITVTAPPVPPTADFTATPLSGDKPLTVAFTDASTGTGPLTYAWDFNNDGTIDSTNANPSWTYADRGTYTVKLTVTGPGGSDDETKLNYITVKTPAPVVDFSASTTSPVKGQSVSFTGTNTGGDVTTWAWDFGDGGTGSGQTPTHTYTTPGTYTVSLTATGPDYTVVKTKTDYITVGAASIDVTVVKPSIDFGTMTAGVDKTDNTGVNVHVTYGTPWTVTATATNSGYMKAGTLQLADPFQLSNGGSYQAMTSNFADFMTGAAGVDGSGTANVKQAIGTGDQPGSYSITLTFTGGMA